MRQGFTLIELMVALAVLMLLAAIGWSSMTDQLPRFRMIRAARLLKSDMSNLRNLAVQSNRETRLRFTDAGGDCSDPDSMGGSWELAIGDSSAGSDSWDLLPDDAFDDGSDDDQSEAYVSLGMEGNHRAAGVCLKTWGTLIGPGNDNADSVVFSPRGWVTNPGGDFSSSGYIEFTLANQQATREGITDEVSVVIFRSGMIRLVSALGTQYPGGSVGTATSSSKQ
ncbi:MAG: prepilin-type N-terminal cleavage/methylation domain-containing protein [Myxococcota bacterium]|jgi:prepilin-type N-terminal cleavage/methylation domain-containing protein